MRRPALFSFLIPFALITLGLLVLGPRLWSLGRIANGTPPLPTLRPLPALSLPAKATHDPLAPILALAPFGRAIALPTPGAQGERRRVERIDLIALFQASDPSASRAALSIDKMPARLFRPGDTLGPGMVLQAVLPDRILARTEQGELSIGFPKPDEAAAPLQAKRPSAAAATAPDRPIEDTLDLYRRDLAANPKRLLDRFALVPTNGGYRIGEAAPLEMRLLGFKPGDLVTHVNGEAVGDVEKDRRLFDKTIVTGLARIALLRDGQPITLSFPLR
jgi:general secretion pathway protein C